MKIVPFDMVEEIYHASSISMFWLWYFDLFDLTFPGIAICSNCGFYPASDCGYGVFDPWTGEFDCEVEDTDDLICEECPHCWCRWCKEKREEK